MDRQPTLTGDLLHLRPLTPSDWPALYAVASDPDIWALHPAHDRWREPVFRAYFDDAIAGGGALAVIDRATEEIIGSSRYGPHDPERNRIEIGWTFLARSHWGGRYNRELKRLMLAHILPQVATVFFTVGEHNLRSRRALEKIGAALTDEVQVRRAGGRDVSHLVYTTTHAPD
ncbi:GNAT family N-acetyltransferase [Sphingomonas lenta]|uniref:GNAT family N-acetyltransferase n=1 Tax=Sphingomonas lenta TaxID=1141887 RepID=A0A2A2SGQ9_9SPHN|nr:GNAT family N-acetyltransferase [Sphingomonas lenta]PAX08408.1 GNAT family N-acetyltransferase [Sphingomonas lenta]